MALDPVTQVSGRAVFIPGADIDTDRIIPARFMKCVTFDGLGEFAFYDVRFDSETGKKTDHPLNDPRFAGASILVAGVNFGCGSSREHAPQSLRKYGFNGVIAESFAEIFFGNSTTLAMPCVIATAADIVKLRDAIESDPATASPSMWINSASALPAAWIFRSPCRIPPARRSSPAVGIRSRNSRQRSRHRRQGPRIALCLSPLTGLRIFCRKSCVVLRRACGADPAGC